MILPPCVLSLPFLLRGLLPPHNHLSCTSITKSHMYYHEELAFTITINKGKVSGFWAHVPREMTRSIWHKTFPRFDPLLRKTCELGIGNMIEWLFILRNQNWNFSNKRRGFQKRKDRGSEGKMNNVAIPAHPSFEAVKPTPPVRSVSYFSSDPFWSYNHRLEV